MKDGGGREGNTSVSASDGKGGLGWGNSKRRRCVIFVFFWFGCLLHTEEQMVVFLVFTFVGGPSLVLCVRSLARARGKHSPP